MKTLLKNLILTLPLSLFFSCGADEGIVGAKITSSSDTESVSVVYSEDILSSEGSQLQGEESVCVFTLDAVSPYSLGSDGSLTLKGDKEAQDRVFTPSPSGSKNALTHELSGTFLNTRTAGNVLIKTALTFKPTEISITLSCSEAPSNEYRDGSSAKTASVPGL